MIKKCWYFSLLNRENVLGSMSIKEEWGAYRSLSILCKRWYKCKNNNTETYIISDGSVLPYDMKTKKILIIQLTSINGKKKKK